MSIARNIERLEADIATAGVRYGVGHRFAGKLNTAMGELRQQQSTLARVLSQVDVPASTNSASLHARKAAAGRWKQAG